MTKSKPMVSVVPSGNVYSETEEKKKRRKLGPTDKLQASCKQYAEQEDTIKEVSMG